MDDKYLPTQYQQYIHLSRYSRWDYDKGRRETWEETVSRYFDFFGGVYSQFHELRNYGIIATKNCLEVLIVKK